MQKINAGTEVSYNEQIDEPILMEKSAYLLEFGQGKLVIDVGTFGNRSAVFIFPAKQPGKVGSSAVRENSPLDRLLGDEVVMTFDTKEHAQRVADAIVGSETH